MMKDISNPRTAVMLVFASFGATVGAWAGAMPKVTASARISAEALGLTLTIMALATVITMSSGSVIGRYANNRTIILLTLPLLSLITFLLLSAPSPQQFMVCAIVLGALLGIMDLFMNAEASAIENHLQRPIFMAFHGAVSVMVAVFALLSSFLSVTVGTGATGLCVILLQSFCWFYLWRCQPIALLKSAPLLTQKAATLPPVRITKRRSLSLMGMAAGLTIACETMSVYWSANLLAEQAPQLAAIAGLGVAFYGSCNAIVRLRGDRLRRAFGDHNILLASMGIAIIGFIALLLSPNFSVSVIAFALVGFGLALVCPILYGMAAATTPENRSSGLAFISLVAGPLRITIPWGFGVIAASFSSSIAFGGCSVLMALAALFVIFLKR